MRGLSVGLPRRLLDSWKEGAGVSSLPTPCSPLSHSVFLPALQEEEVLKGRKAHAKEADLFSSQSPGASAQ